MPIFGFKLSPVLKRGAASPIRILAHRKPFAWRDQSAREPNTPHRVKKLHTTES
jgi:hypothetical protein